MAKPKYRVVYKDADGENHKVGTIWSTKFAGLLNFSPVIEPNEDFNEMAFSEALEAYSKKEGFLNVYEYKPKERRQQDADEDFE